MRKGYSETRGMVKCWFLSVLGVSESSGTAAEAAVGAHSEQNRCRLRERRQIPGCEAVSWHPGALVLCTRTRQELLSPLCGDPLGPWGCSPQRLQMGNWGKTTYVFLQPQESLSQADLITFTSAPRYCSLLFLLPGEGAGVAPGRGSRGKSRRLGSLGYQTSRKCQPYARPPAQAWGDMLHVSAHKQSVVRGVARGGWEGRERPWKASLRRWRFR